MKTELIKEIFDMEEVSRQIEEMKFKALLTRINIALCIVNSALCLVLLFMTLIKS